MSRVILCNRFAYPDKSATSQLLWDLALNLKASGKKVMIVTGRGIYDSNERKRLAAHETWQGVDLIRVWSSQFGRNNLIFKAIDLTTFYISILLKLAVLLRKGDVLIAKTDPPLLSVASATISRLRGALLINWLQDLYPEIAVALGVLPHKSKFVDLLRYMRDWSLKVASANVVISDSMYRRVANIGVKVEKIILISNWTDENVINGIPPYNNFLTSSWGLDGMFVVGYSGNLGRAHDFSTVIDAACILKNETNIRFLMIGGGRSYEILKKIIFSKKLSHKFIFKPYQKREDLSLSLSVADVHWVSLNPDCEGMIFPSKVFGIAAARRPIIAVAAKNNDLDQLVTKYDCGYTVLPGDSVSFAARVKFLAENKTILKTKGNNARLMIEQRFSRASLLDQWSDLVHKIGS